MTTKSYFRKIFKKMFTKKREEIDTQRLQNDAVYENESTKINNEEDSLSVPCGNNDFSPFKGQANRQFELKQLNDSKTVKDNFFVTTRQSPISVEYSGYDIGDVHVCVPVSCIGTYIGSVSDAIRLGKYELAHGLALDENNNVKLSLKEMKKYGYIVPEGYEINEEHDTLIPKFATAFEPCKLGLYQLKIPVGFNKIEDGEYAGELVPIDPELIADIQDTSKINI